MSNFSSTQTGPKTAEGKAASSRNAIKLGVYSNSLMPGESEQELQDLNNALRDALSVEDGASEMLLRTISQSLLKTKRLHDAEIKVVQTYFARQDSRKQFGFQANISPLLYDRLPDWYFEEDPEPKKRALVRFGAVCEAIHLKENFKLENSLQARTVYPNLWAEVMGRQAINPRQSLGERLLARYRQAKPEFNLQALVEDYYKKYPFDMLWGENHERYEMVIENLRAQALIEVSLRPDLAKVEMQLHRRRIEAIETIARLNSARAIEMASVVTPSKELVLPHSKQNPSSQKASTKNASNQELLIQKATTNEDSFDPEVHLQASSTLSPNEN